jgi:uncharacterized protein YdaU (DUF1376 family)
MANNPIFPFYVNDFEGGTRHMTDEEVGCYLRLLLAQFNRGGFLPPDENFLSRFCTSFKESWPIVKEKFLKTENGLQNKRLEHERVKREKFVIHQSENGKKGGRPKKPKPFINETQNLPNEKPLGKGKGNRKGEGNIENGNGHQDRGLGEDSADEKFLLPQMCKIWYETFPTYTADRQSDFDGMGKMLQFIYRHAPNPKDVQNPDTQIKVLNTLQLIADQVNREPFWVNKPIKSIANNIQEFYNKIKNPIDGKQSTGTGSNQQSNLRTEVQAELNRRFAKRQ